MLKELIALFQFKEPLEELGESFQEMLRLSLGVVKEGGAIFFAGTVPSLEQRKALQKRDLHVNRLERSIRRQLVVHLSAAGQPEIPYCLLLMSLIKDTERIGDYGKDLAVVLDLTDEPVPDDDVVDELRRIASAVESELEAVCQVVRDADRELAISLIRAGRGQVNQCEALVAKISHGHYSAGTAVALAVATRCYLRISGHVLNLLSSVVMPLERLDYYDEKDIARAERVRET